IADEALHAWARERRPDELAEAVHDQNESHHHAQHEQAEAWVVQPHGVLLRQAGMKLTLGSNRRANTASKRAARSRSSRATISLGLCIYRLGTLTSPVGIPRSAL